MVTTVSGSDEPLTPRLTGWLERNVVLFGLVLAGLAMGLAPAPFASLGAAALIVVARRR